MYVDIYIYVHIYISLSLYLSRLVLHVFRADTWYLITFQEGWEKSILFPLVTVDCL